MGYMMLPAGPLPLSGGNRYTLSGGQDYVMGDIYQLEAQLATLERQMANAQSLPEPQRSALIANLTPAIQSVRAAIIAESQRGGQSIDMTQAADFIGRTLRDVMSPRTAKPASPGIPMEAATIGGAAVGATGVILAFSGRPMIGMSIAAAGVLAMMLGRGMFTT